MEPEATLMGSIWGLVLGTIILRPYFLLFFLTYLVGSTVHLGLMRAILFAILGYALAWLSEYSSIHTGIPYGLYNYIETTRGRELWVMGVPFMDSMSFVFLAYAAYSMALVVVAPIVSSRRMIYLLETKKARASWAATILGALFFVYLDIIIDPVALQGSRWFLGQIYHYPHGGAYFGVPLSNFVGWFIVGFLLIRTLQATDRFLDVKGVKDRFAGHCRWRHLGGPALYAGVILFNLWVTFSIGEHTMGWAGVFIVLFPSVLLCQGVRRKLLRRDMDQAVAEHLADFPAVVIPGLSPTKKPIQG
jgi:putative membrane protein